MNAEELLNAGTVASADIGHMYNFILTADDGPGVLAAQFLAGRDGPADAFIGRECGLLGTRASWSPDDVQPTKPVWVLVAVERGRPALGGIGPYDGHWYRVPPKDFPWFMAATAGGIRDSIEHGTPLVLKQIEDERLLGKVADLNVPPSDEHGNI